MPCHHALAEALRAYIDSVITFDRNAHLSQRHHRLLITATTITDTTRGTTSEDITVLTADTPWGALRRPPRQTRPRGTERHASFPRMPKKPDHGIR